MDFKPKPTEYAGVRFDSKLEAVFARFLDLNRIHWEKQHPVTCYGHDWDFEISTNKYKRLLIELKPSFPTETYADNILTASGRADFLADPHATIVCGNPWTPITFWKHRGFLCTCPEERHCWRSLKDIVENNFLLIQQSLNYRFDLQQSRSFPACKKNS